MEHIIHNFQFIRPLYLLGLVPVLIIYLLKLKFGKNQNLWQQIIPSHLYQHVVISKGIRQSSKFIHFAFVFSLIGIGAAAGPTWEKLPQVVYQTQAGKVILMDMSLSMRASDISPNRLTRARFKAMDLLDEVQEGETGLVAYSGDAFVVSPLTDDVTNLNSLIPVLSPEIMPTQGSFALMGLERASELLDNAGYQTGQIYWLTDGIRIDEVDDIRRFIQSSQYKISALLIGTEDGAPVTLEDGQLLKDRTGKIVIPTVDAQYMEQAMSGTSARYQLFTSDNKDIQAIKRQVEFELQAQAEEVENVTGDIFKDMGPYLVLLLLPIAAYSFRKGVMSYVFVCMTATLLWANSTNIAMAQSPEASLPNEPAPPAQQSALSLVDKVFKNADQQGKVAFDNQDFNQANQLFKDKEWKAASAYKNGDFELAEALYSDLQGKENTYNKANASAKLGKLEEALDAYNQVLAQDPSHENALKNKAIVEELMKQQQENPQDQQQEGGDSSEQNKQDNQSGEQNQENQSGEQDQSDQQGENGQQDEQSQEGQQQQDDNQNSEQSEQEQQSQGDENEQALEDAANESEQQDEQQNEQQGQSDASSEPQKDEQTPQQQDMQQQSAISNEMNMDDLTPEEKEELQRMQMILNKVPDDPAYLLKRKMLLEAYKRKGAPPPPTQQNW